MTDNVNHPQHYTTTGIECIEYIKQIMTPQEFVGYLRGNAIKYQHRLMLKGLPSENADKARWYTERLVLELKGLETTK